MPGGCGVVRTRPLRAARFRARATALAGIRVEFAWLFWGCRAPQRPSAGHNRALGGDIPARIQGARGPGAPRYSQSENTSAKSLPPTPTCPSLLQCTWSGQPSLPHKYPGRPPDRIGSMPTT